MLDGMPWYTDCGPLDPASVPDSTEPWEIARAIEMAFARGVCHGLVAASGKQSSRVDEMADLACAYRHALSSAETAEEFAAECRDRLTWRLIGETAAPDGGAVG